MPLRLDAFSRAVIQVLDDTTLTADDLFGSLKNHSEHWYLVQHQSREAFGKQLTSMWKAGLISEPAGEIVIGPQWRLIKPYEERLAEYRQSGKSIDQLAQSEPWIQTLDVELR